ncbi:MAG: hypothetical protein E7091_06075 [Bacteroidales bacterium]|nr:hypothetical protein [Bacteroidales bacterium]
MRAEVTVLSVWSWRTPLMWVRHINNKQLYTEVMVALGGGERCWFNEEETRQLEAHNADYSARRGVWDLLNRYFTVCDIPNDTEERIDTLWPATEVYDFFYDLSPMSMAGIERSGFAHYLKRLGAQQVRVKNRRLYGGRNAMRDFYMVLLVSLLSLRCANMRQYFHMMACLLGITQASLVMLSLRCACHPKYELFSPY